MKPFVPHERPRLRVNKKPGEDRAERGVKSRVRVVARFGQRITIIGLAIRYELMSELVNYAKQGDIGVITIDNPPVNALSPGVPEGIMAGIEAAAKDPEVKAVVVIGGGRTFIAGADIREFGKVTSGEKPRFSLNSLLEKIEDSAKPVIIAIHGTAFGGGLEVAMSGHYRVAVASAQVGQPEVKLGIVPGYGGSQRLPRLVGMSKALEMNLVGDPVLADEAFELGLANRLVEDHELLDTALAWARKFSSQAPLASAEIKRVSDASSLDAGIEAEKSSFSSVFASADAREGISAFLDKRAPHFSGH